MAPEKPKYVIRNIPKAGEKLRRLIHDLEGQWTGVSASPVGAEPSASGMQVAGTLDELQIDGKTPRSLADERLAITAEEFLPAVTSEGVYVRKADGTPSTAPARAGKRWGFWPRKFVVFTVRYKSYILYVVWGFPEQVEDMLGCRILCPPEWRELFQPFVLGWDFDPQAAKPFPIVSPHAKKGR